MVEAEEARINARKQAAKEKQHEMEADKKGSKEPKDSKDSKAPKAEKASS